MQEPELQVDALIETSSAKIKARNRVAIGHLIDNLKFIGLVRHFFQRTSGYTVAGLKLLKLFTFPYFTRIFNIPC